jgi:class 3 adenylate cyclase
MIACDGGRSPDGVVTLLFTDVEGSTRLLQELGDDYTEALYEHRRRLRAAFAENEGVEVDTQGDAFFVAFARASDAVAAAAGGQRALAGGPIRVRMGLHTGEPRLTNEGYVGLDVHKGARYRCRRARRTARQPPGGAVDAAPPGTPGTV